MCTASDFPNKNVLYIRSGVLSWLLQIELDFVITIENRSGENELEPAARSLYVLIRKSDAFLRFPVQMTPRIVERNLLLVLRFSTLFFYFDQIERGKKQFTRCPSVERARRLNTKKNDEEIGNWQKLLLKMLRLLNGKQRQMELIINVFIKNDFIVRFTSYIYIAYLGHKTLNKYCIFLWTSLNYCFILFCSILAVVIVILCSYALAALLNLYINCARTWEQAREEENEKEWEKKREKRIDNNAINFVFLSFVDF